MYTTNYYALNPEYCPISLNIISIYQSKVVAPHTTWHMPSIADDECVLVTVNGSGKITFKDGTVLVHKKGDITFTNHHLIDYMTCEEGNWEYNSFWFQLDGLNLPRITRNVDINGFDDFTVKLISLINDGTAYSIRSANNLFLQKILDLMNQVNFFEVVEKYPEIVKDLVKYINDNIYHNPKLSDIALKFGYCERQLRNLFIKHLKITPKQYINNRRMRIAASLLAHTFQTVESISSSLGYSSPYHFMTAFKQYYGESPKKYRQIHADKSDEKGVRFS